MNFDQVETEVKKLSKKIRKESFVFDFLSAFGTAKSTITMLKNGSRNLSKKENEIVCKKKIFFSSVDEDVESAFEDLISNKGSFKHDPRFIIATDHKELFALDTKTNDRVDFKITDLYKKFAFFLPLAGIEKKEFQHENPVDVKAAEKLAKLFDLIKGDNPKSDEKSLHSLNVFLTRLLFCYFAEDTDIFPKGLFTGNVSSHTQPDGSDLDSYLKKLFAIMNVEARPKDLPDYIAAFPYVNGGLFAETHPIPKFSKKSRAALLGVGDLNWAEINPDIFGSMIQAVVHPDQRAGLGMHYTSVNNIMKVIEPLFLNDLYEELEKCKKSTNKLKKLLKRISEVKIFDPACGSGNFLIIAYKELRKLEMEVYKHLPGEMKFSYIPLSNFYGIEIDDFAHEVAVLSLWLAQHQMDVKFYEEFGTVKASLPLKDGGNIICGNSNKIEWESVCPNGNNDEIYILGNPPYLGTTYQSKDQKKEIESVFTSYKNYKKLDYISCWFLKASSYVSSNNIKAAFVSTNSICQGEQVSLLWEPVFNNNVEIFFAHQSFKWTNNAKNKAGVTCIIVGLCVKGSSKNKLLFSEGVVNFVKNINAYLLNSDDVIIKKRSKPLSPVPSITYGNKAVDGGHLILTTPEKEAFLSEYPSSIKYIKKLTGSNEFINGSCRWCIWIRDDELKNALKIDGIKKRVSSVKKTRLASKDSGANKLASRPHQFRDVFECKSYGIIIPRHSSERRPFLSLGIVDRETIILDSGQVLYDPEMYIFGILSSHIHMLWTKTVSGGIETRINYSSTICYNNFPFPELNQKQKDEITKLSYGILEIREKYPELTIAQMYNPDKMPKDLREKHMELSSYVEKCFRKKEFRSDQERLEFLFNCYKEKCGA